MVIYMSLKKIRGRGRKSTAPEYLECDKELAKRDFIE
jgi:hypothetical protein